MGIVEEECDEALHWIDVLLGCGLARTALVAELQKEGSEILAITVQSIKTARNNAKKLP
jgi:hypothetical protein